MTATIAKKTPTFLAADLSAFEKLDTAIHSKVRLSLVSILAVNEALSFTELRDGLSLTDGNLAAHLRALTRDGIIRQRKIGNPLKPTTLVSLTASGRTSFRRYLDGLAHIVKRHR
ncbi:MAG: transcriptional regulator [Verrucomicrobiota bacterium]